MFEREPLEHVVLENQLMVHKHHGFYNAWIQERS